MNGLLLKWAGYFSGWNENYFILEDGTLSLFQSRKQHDDGFPAQDSINVGLCEISVDANDDLQWELKSTNSKQWFLKAHSSSQKHKWIQALGTSKACLLGSSLHSHLPMYERRLEKIEDIGNRQVVTPLPSDVEAGDANDDQADEILDDQKLNLLKKCDITIAAIVEFKTILEKNEPVECALVASKFEDLLLDIKLWSDTATVPDTASHSPIVDDTGPRSPITLDTVVEESREDGTKHLDTFFTLCPTTFANVRSHMKTTEGGELVPFSLFLDACNSYADMLNHLAPTLLVPIRNDVLSNVKKIQTARDALHQDIQFVQELLKYEVDTNQYKGPDTASQALLWLNRSLLIMASFFDKVFDQTSETYQVTSTSFVQAYDEELAPHHNWMVQRLFKMGVKMLPSYSAFLVNLVEADSVARLEEGGGDWKKMLEDLMQKQCKIYVRDMKHVAFTLRSSLSSFAIDR